MSGVFGILDARQNTQIEALLAKMGQAMSHREWYVVETHHEQEAGVGLGRIGIGIFNQAPQPVWNATRTVALMMAGEFYDTDTLQENDDAASDEQLALKLYEQAGEDFAAQLNGAFIIAIWDRARRHLVIVNDRFGLYPLFYAHHAGRLIFAPEIKGVLCDEALPRELDLTALAQYMRFQHLLGERTFFEGITLLPPASVLVYDLSSAACHVRPYWTFDDVPYRPEVSFDEAVAETGRLLRRAVRRLSGDGYRPGVYLSGGLDSRTILGLSERRPIVSLTFGLQNCRDVYYARRIAGIVGSDHHWFNLPNGEWIKEHVDSHLDLTEGLHSWIHAHGISILPQARQLVDVNLTGWDGGTIMGDPDTLEPLQEKAVDEMALATRLFYLLTQKYTWPGLTEAEAYLVYSDSLRQKMHGRAFESLREEMAKYLTYRPDVRSEYFYVNNHCRRMTFNMVTIARSYIEVRFPFFDYDLFDFLHSLPAQLRADKLLFRSVIQRETPRLAYIPYDHDEFLPTTRTWLRNTQALAVKLKRRFNRHLWPLFAERYTLYADYENYLRGELKEWAEGILFDPHTAERDIFNTSFVRTLMDRHLSGLEEWTIGKIAPIMTFEMMLRRLYD